MSWPKGRKHTLETRKKQSVSHIGEKNPFFGKHHTEEAKLKNKIVNLGRFKGKNNPFYGKHHTKESNLKNSLTHIGLQVGEKNGMFGKHHDEETKKLQSKSHIGLLAGEKHYLWGKHLPESHKKNVSIATSGEKNHCWQGGKSFETYGLEFNNILKDKIRERDNFTCQECNYSEDKLNYKLSIHHIDYDKKNNDPNNLISLCKSCHLKTNFNRDNWTQYYKNRREDAINIVS